METPTLRFKTKRYLDWADPAKYSKIVIGDKAWDSDESEDDLREPWSSKVEGHEELWNTEFRENDHFCYVLDPGRRYPIEKHFIGEEQVEEAEEGAWESLREGPFLHEVGEVKQSPTILQPKKKQLRYFSAYNQNPFQRSFACTICQTLNHPIDSPCPSKTCPDCKKTGHWECQPRSSPLEVEKQYTSDNVIPEVENTKYVDYFQKAQSSSDESDSDSDSDANWGSPALKKAEEQKGILEISKLKLFTIDPCESCGNDKAGHHKNSCLIVEPKDASKNPLVVCVVCGEQGHLRCRVVQKELSSLEAVDFYMLDDPQNIKRME